MRSTFTSNFTSKLFIFFFYFSYLLNYLIFNAFLVPASVSCSNSWIVIALFLNFIPVFTNLISWFYFSSFIFSINIFVCYLNYSFFFSSALCMNLSPIMPSFIIFFYPVYPSSFFLKSNFISLLSSSELWFWIPFSYSFASFKI